MKRLEKMESHLNSRLDEIDARLDRTEDRLDNLKTISD
jgi:predicted  nucleic acid-binding Zn-ribbon protein